MVAQKKQSVKQSTKTPSRGRAATTPVFPYTNKPGSLRKFLQEIPKRPKPPRVDKTVLQSWGLKDTNDLSIIRVLKAAGLISQTNEPTETYSQFMNINGGAAALAKPLRVLYAPLFTASHTPYRESSDTLKNLFNIHSGGSGTTLDFQIQTFKALAESTIFDEATQTNLGGAKPGTSTVPPEFSADATQVPVHINLHIHLPDNKTRRDYEAIIEDIGRYIFGKTSGGRSNE
jgi:hypothetical protein